MEWVLPIRETSTSQYTRHTCRSGTRLISTESNGCLNGIKTILRSSSGAWEMKPVTDRYFTMRTNGSNNVMLPVLYNLNRLAKKKIQISLLRCIPVLEA